MDYVLFWNSFEDSFNDDLKLDFIANVLLFKSQFEPPWFKKRYKPEEFSSWSKDQ
ncbi:MAG: hypothetical protein K9K32_04925 [Halanaerobiales bacterium]|nr:hypothetical protein [Halanaerobiales bacterium]